MPELDVDQGEILLEELQKAVTKLKNNKAAGEDGTNAELIKHSSDNNLMMLLKLLNLVWKEEKNPEIWKRVPS